MSCPKTEAVTCFGRLEQHLQVSVRPLPQRAIGARTTARVENLTQLHDETLPLLIGETAIEIDGASDADAESEKRPRRGAEAHIDRARSLRDGLGRNAHLGTD